jgi:hypothetical protein
MRTAIDWLVEQLENHTGVTRKGFEYVINEAKEIERNHLIDFFKFFRDNGENNIGLTIEQFVELYLKQNDVS